VNKTNVYWDKQGRKNMAVQMSIQINVKEPEEMSRLSRAAETRSWTYSDWQAIEEAEKHYEEEIIEAIKRKMETVIVIPESENVLIYRQQVISEDKERSLEDALDFMVNMASRSGRKVLSHSVAYEPKINDPLSGWDSAPKYFYCITMILAPK
jgi:hypothetical protein